MFSAITLFCEDVREEKSGMNTVVGIFPDNIEANKIPFSFAKLAVYTRLILDIDKEYRDISITLMQPGQEKRILTNVPPDLVAKSKEDARSQRAPIAGIISRTIMAGFKVETEGRIVVTVGVNGEEHISGTLNIRLKKTI